MPLPITDALIDGLATLLKDHEQGTVPAELTQDSRAYVLWRLSKVLDEMDPDRAPLDPLTAAVFGLSRNVVLSLIRELPLSEEDGRQIVHLPKPQQARRLAQLFEEDPDLLSEVLAPHLFATRTSVRTYQISGLTGDSEMLTAIGEATGVDLLNGQGLGVSTKIPKPMLQTPMPDGRVAVTYSVARQGRQFLDASFRPTSVAHQRMVTLVVDTGTGSVEVRGSASEHERVLSQFTKDLRKGGVHAEISQLQLTEVEVNRLRDALEARVLREKRHNPNGATDGIASNEVAVDQTFGDGNADLTETPAYQALPQNWEKSRWFLSFTLDGVEYNIFINLKSGTIQFTQGKSNEEVLAHVLNLVRSIREEAEGDGDT